jgi:hypothetical protein
VGRSRSCVAHAATDLNPVQKLRLLRLVLVVGNQSSIAKERKPLDLLSGIGHDDRVAWRRRSLWRRLGQGDLLGGDASVKLHRTVVNEVLGGRERREPKLEPLGAHVRNEGLRVLLVGREASREAEVVAFSDNQEDGLLGLPGAPD